MKMYSGIAFIDFETTGLDPKENYPTEVAIKLYYRNIIGKPETIEYQTLIKLPEGVEISEFIQDLTGLTTEKVNSEGKPLEEVIPEVQKLLSENVLVVAQNANFDLGYLSVHFGIEPDHFVCTKTIEFFTAPHLSTSLKDAHKRYAPDKTFEQTHRAMDDVNMLVDIYDGQFSLHGEDQMDFFKNKIAVMPERPLVFTPHNAVILDYSQKYSSNKTVEKLKEEIKELEDEVEVLDCLRAAGVDNWEGYSDAMEMVEEGDE